MDRDTEMLPMVAPKLVPDYRGVAGEQAFYTAVTLDLGWFERGMRAVARLLPHVRPAGPAARAAVAH